MVGHVVLGPGPHDGEVRLVVSSAVGSDLYRADLRIFRALRGVTDPAEADGVPVPGTVPGELDVPTRELAEGELVAAGWVRCGAWASGVGLGGPLTATTVVTSRPRRPVIGHDEQVLEALRRMTVMARGPVTSTALVPVVAPRWQAASAQMRRLVAAGQVRAVGRTTGDRVCRTLYAPVGSPWAPDVDGLERGG